MGAPHYRLNFLSAHCIYLRWCLWLTLHFGGTNEAAPSHGQRKKTKRYLVSYIDRSSSPSARKALTVFSLGHYTDGQDFSQFFIVFYLLRHHSWARDQGVCRCVGQRLRLLVMMSAVVLCRRCYWVTGSSERERRGCIYVGPTRSVCHVITWMGGRYMKDWLALVIWCLVYTSLCNSVFISSSS